MGSTSDYSPNEIDARELFYIWKKQVERKYDGNLIPISWYVKRGERGKPEYMPFQYEHFKGLARKNFLSFFTEPINVATGEKLNWLTIPVIDKLWSAENGGQKGGFIQEATGWKPSALQPFVYLPALSSSL